jgi:ADP-ribose pyrophosphatase
MSDKPEDFTETRIRSDVVYDGALLRVLSDEVRLPDGTSARREYISHPGASAVVAMLDRETLLLERQFRYPLGRHFIELPAGKIDPGEDALATAQRELREECGYTANAWRHLATLHPCIGYADERIELFLATGLQRVEATLDDGEFLEVLEVKVADALAWIREGRITEPKAITGVLWADKLLKGEWA